MTFCAKDELCAYKLQLVRRKTRKDHDSRRQFALEILSHIEDDETYNHRLCFPDDATFKRHNCRVWWSENPHDDTEHEQDSPKVNVWCTLMKNQNYGSFVFWRTYGEWGRFSVYEAERCFASCPCGDDFPVRGCTTSLPPSCRAFLDREFPDRWI